ncbi:hypothetical protein [uncultured Aquimarina sp.]|uniref:hypothetical protein n=1 Tax=uncultured Aquimarina sp. TaxID=575652 RepID=UPI00262DB5B4|nr:hypothetical protein [uncultured Aquimarina sp.]
MSNYLKKIKGLIAELSSLSSISDVVFEKGIGISSEDFMDYSKEYELAIPDEVKGFYSEFDGFKLIWNYRTNELNAANTLIEENVEILSFYNMFKGYDGRSWENEIWDEQTPMNDLSLYKRLKILDYFEKDNVHCVCIEISKENVLTTKLWLFRQGYKPIPMTIDVTQYIDKLCFTKGFWGWQYYFTNVDFSSSEFEGIKLDIQNSMAFYSKFFPEILILESKK